MANVSVIVPVYNVEAYLPACLDSVLSQTLSDIEVICINDGSPDHSLQILKEYAAKDARVKIIDKPNEGVGKARNDGIAAATGDFIAFMDSDDWYPDSGVLERMYRAAVDNRVKIAGGYYKKVYADGHEEVAKPTFDGLSFDVRGVTAYGDYQYDYGYTAFLFETAMLKEHHILFPPYARFQDPPFFVKAMVTAGEFYALDDVTYCYRMLPSTVKYSATKTLDMLKGVEDNLRLSKENSLAKLHYISACRLDKEASFMALQNIYDAAVSNELMAAVMRGSAAVDAKWLQEEGFDMAVPFVPQLFLQLRDTAKSYEAMRKTKLAKAMTWLPRKLFR